MVAATMGAAAAIQAVYIMEAATTAIATVGTMPEVSDHHTAVVITSIRAPVTNTVGTGEPTPSSSWLP